MAGTRKFPQTQQQADAAGAAAMLDAKAEAPLVGAFRDSDAAMSGGAAIGSKEIGDAVETLQKYKQGKSNFENRIISEERWWKLRHWEDIRRGTNPPRRNWPKISWRTCNQPWTDSVSCWQN